MRKNDHPKMSNMNKSDIFMLRGKKKSEMFLFQNKRQQFLKFDGGSDCMRIMI